jgi:DNA-binding transcriptional LysR family regulator
MISAAQIGQLRGLENPLGIHIICETISQMERAMDNRIGEMQVFMRVVEAGSFSEAARLLRMNPSTISKLISRIEARLGVRLLERSSRRLSMTSEGQIYYERSQGLLRDFEEVERELSQGSASTGGTVRVNASVALGALALEPLLPEFFAAYPNIVIDLSLSDELVGCCHVNWATVACLTVWA